MGDFQIAWLTMVVIVGFCGTCYILGCINNTLVDILDALNGEDQRP